MIVYTISTIGTFSASARIPFPFFKDISSNFYESTEAYSPTLGIPAVDSGLIDNIRFFSVVQAYSENRRDYAHDKPLENDHIGHLVLKLFPSIGGQLATLSGHPNNFGRRLKSPETIALLLNYAFYKEQGWDVDKQDFIDKAADTLHQRNFEKDELERELEKEISRLKELTTDNNSDALKNTKEALIKFINDNFTKDISSALLDITKARKFLSYNKNINLEKHFSNIKNQLKKALCDRITKLQKEDVQPRVKLITDIINLIEKEILYQKNNISFYPRHMVQITLSAFFVQHFNTKEDIKTLLINLDNNIVDKNSLSSFDSDDILSVSDLEHISKKNALDIDDILALFTSDIWFSPTPYRNGTALLNYGKAHPFDRKNNTILWDRSFSDCAEMALRHICNLLFFNKEINRWDLSHINDQENNPYFIQLKEFYQKYPVSAANAGDSSTRSVWNKVVGDMNSNDPAEPKIRYGHGENEICGGLVNLMQIFGKLLGLSFPEVPVNLSSKMEWINDSLISILKKMNPKYSYYITFDEDVAIENNDTAGTLNIRATLATDKIFEFSLHSRPGHTEIKNFNTILTDNKTNYKHIISKYHGKSLEIFFLLIEGNNYYNKIAFPFYRLCGKSVYDDSGKTGFIKRLIDYPTDNSPNDSLNLLNKLLENIGSDIDTDNETTFAQCLPLLMKLLFRHEYSNTAKNILKKSIKNQKTTIALFNCLNRLKTDDLNANITLINDALSYSTSLLQIENLNDGQILFLMHSLDLKGIFQENLENSFLKIHTLNFSSKEAGSISQSHLAKLKNLKSLRLTNYDWVSEVIDLSSLEHLNTINLNNNGRLKRIELPPQIKKIKLSSLPNFTSINFDNYKEITTLELEKLPNFDHLAVQDLPKLVRLYIHQTPNIGQIKIANLPALKFVCIESLPALTTLTMEKIPSLTIFILSDAPLLPDLYTLENLSTLETLVIEGTEHAPMRLKNINIEKMLDLNLLTLGYHSEIKELDLRKNTKLQKAILHHLMLEKLNVTDLTVQHLNVTEAKNIDRTNIIGLDTLPSEAKILINEDDEENWLAI